MRVQILGPGEHDRHEAEVRFVAKVDGERIDVTITDSGLFIIGQALDMPTGSEPLSVFAASGSLLNRVVEDAILVSGAMQATYLVSNANVLRVTGSQPGLPHVPKRWKAN